MAICFVVIGTHQRLFTAPCYMVGFRITCAAFQCGNLGLPARTQAVYQTELTNETAAVRRFSARGPASFSKAGKNLGSTYDRPATAVRSAAKTALRWR